MTLAEIKNQVMFQTNNDAEDLGDYEPHINDYVNEGYDRLVYAYAHQHVDDTSDYPPLEMDMDEPDLPGWTHRAVADFATWLVYRNGNPQKQSRGMAYLRAFEEMLTRIAECGGIDGLDENGKQKRYRNFINIPR